jgi:hypothetical protein
VIEIGQARQRLVGTLLQTSSAFESKERSHEVARNGEGKAFKQVGTHPFPPPQPSVGYHCAPSGFRPPAWRAVADPVSVGRFALGRFGRDESLDSDEPVQVPRTRGCSGIEPCKRVPRVENGAQQWVVAHQRHFPLVPMHRSSNPSLTESQSSSSMT